MAKKKFINEEIEVGTILTITFDSISYVASSVKPGEINNNKTEQKIELKSPVNCDLICEYGRNKKDKYWYCHSSEKPLAIRLTSKNGQSVYFDLSSGFENAEIAKIEIERKVGSMYETMLNSSLEKESEGTNFQFTRDRLDKLEFLNDKSNEEKNQMASDQCENNKRRLIIYTWYFENCTIFI